VKNSDIRAFAARPWAAIEAEKRSYWAAAKRDMTPLEALAVSEDLRKFTQQIRPDFPTTRDREADIEMHIRLSEGLRSVAIRRR
jgi:hypothetical protein